MCPGSDTDEGQQLANLVLGNWLLGDLNLRFFVCELGSMGGVQGGQVSIDFCAGGVGQVAWRVGNGEGSFI